ncbi:Cysteine proteinase inhibitor 5 [Ananas comosus]|uniref:Cysteine proteinase inhibitor 5 n=1 Tax=Ananas comosus TaxID=4615 RepID=A0A199UTP1_ANACO|nr:Cysteine proteinase inhibitor 5 [Ananas comosus]
MRSVRLRALPLLLLLLLVEGEARGGAVAGGWRRIEDVGEAHVREIGEYAVAEHDRETGAGLAFVRVLRGETQVVAGINYRLVLQTNNNAAGSECYEAVVWEKAWQGFRKLTSFRPV